MTKTERKETYKYIESLSQPAHLPRPPLRFTYEHPNLMSHKVYLAEQPISKVLTWIGGVLPRNDKPEHDKEAYSLAMSVFFRRPGWRTGMELKTATQTWQEAFQSAPFPLKAIDVMKNMRSVYECNDARHDFASKRRAGVAPCFPVFGPSTEEAMDEIDAEADAEDYMEGYETLDAETVAGIVNHNEEMGERTLRVKEQMAEMRRLMGSLPSAQPQTSPDADVLCDAEKPNLHPSQWKSILDEERQRHLKAKMAALLPNDEFDNTGNKGHGQYHNGDAEGKITILEPSHLDAICKLYTCKEYSALPPLVLVKQIAYEFSLNEDQLRAYEKTAAHIVSDINDPLRLYLGGMGGTGKSQVIKAVIALLAARNESHRFVVMAPTGAAASLLDGSTYHSILSFGHGKIELTDGTRDRLHGELEHVEFFFLDEISMISCADLCNISRRLQQVFQKFDVSFGGKNVILAGDFAQLPPPGRGKKSLYSSSVADYRPGLKAEERDECLGKAVWHEFTDVVILRENMRQRGSSQTDIAFRRLLENLRYGACTEKDLVFLRKRIIGHGLTTEIMEKPEFRNVSILTAINSHRDGINETKAKHFAKQKLQPLTSFYSYDKWDTLKYLRSLNEDQLVKRDHHVRNMQKYLWSIPPALADHRPGVLQLCKGMPVMLKYNEATEVCATNGAEGEVVGWDANPGQYGRLTLGTLFVRLTNPPRNVQVGSLPENVIPVASKTESIDITLGRKDEQFHVRRHQVQVVLNFAMTVHAAQGRTRHHNVVDLAECPTHQSLYTCLSRSSSFEGTVILRDFNMLKMCSGASGDLRKEFKELEILDYLTELKMTGDLPEDAPRHNRRAIIDWYVEVNKGWLMPPKAHQSLLDKGVNPRKRTSLLENFASAKRRKIGPQYVSTAHKRMFILSWDSIDWSSDSWLQNRVSSDGGFLNRERQTIPLMDSDMKIGCPG
ncbi:hypothetical protein NLI96_g7135 [Meripilus lineatus]|uniref:ATP-dependent DNA helicase n=1 Tax=Meripilus lineatus TaxID=2056292 RepID=A0AAD5V1I4_9APHY|nr:hypothetical protein NLI96_g7135 [Physisporinus lineatus]